MKFTPFARVHGLLLLARVCVFFFPPVYFHSVLFCFESARFVPDKAAFVTDTTLRFAEYRISKCRCARNVWKKIFVLYIRNGRFVPTFFNCKNLLLSTKQKTNGKARIERLKITVNIVQLFVCNNFCVFYIFPRILDFLGMKYRRVISCYTVGC